MSERLAPILAPYRGQRGATIPVLQKVQEELGYLSEESISEIANFLGLSKNEVYGVASFYAQFRFHVFVASVDWAISETHEAS